MRTVPLKHLVRINERSLPETTDSQFEFRYVDIGAVGRGTLIDEPACLVFADAPSRARRLVRAGDTIVSTVRTYLRAVWPVEEPADDLVVSTGFAVLTPRTGIEARFLGWLVQSDVVVEDVVARSVGVSYPAINAMELGEIRVPVPSEVEQRAIAHFLDAETARIDALITKKRRLVAAIDQRRWAALASEIRSTAAPMVPLRRAFLSITDGPFGSAFSSGEYSDEGVVVVRLGNIGFAEWRGEMLAHLPDQRFAEFKRHRVRMGDLLFAGLGDVNNHAGRACVAPDLGRAIVKGKCFCAQVDRSIAVPDYLALVCSSPFGADATAVEARGSTRSMINLDIIKAMHIPLPELAVQSGMVERVRNLWATIRSVRDSLDRSVSLLQERRQALLTAAVTGELDVGAAHRKSA